MMFLDGTASTTYDCSDVLLINRSVDIFLEDSCGVATILSKVFPSPLMDDIFRLVISNAPVS